MESKLHHVGFVVKDIAAAADHYAAWLGLELIGDITEDATQRAKVAFLGTNSDVSVELIEALDDDSPVARLAKQGGGLHHLCYSVGDLDAAAAHLRSQRALEVCEPVAAPAFAGRRIAFFYLPDRSLIELLEETGGDGQG